MIDYYEQIIIYMVYIRDFFVDKNVFYITFINVKEPIQYISILYCFITTVRSFQKQHKL